MAKFGPPRNPFNCISFESWLTTGIEKCSFCWIWATMSKVMGIFCQILAFLTMPAHQIWSCHVPQEANFENFHFVLILHLILGSHKYSSGKAPYFNSYQPKTSRGGENTPLPLPLGLIVGMRNHCIGNDSQLQMFTLYRMGFRSSSEIYPIQCEQCSWKSKWTVPDRPYR